MEHCCTLTWGLRNVELHCRTVNHCWSSAMNGRGQHHRIHSLKVGIIPIVGFFNNTLFLWIIAPKSLSFSFAVLTCKLLFQLKSLTAFIHTQYIIRADKVFFGDFAISYFSGLCCTVYPWVIWNGFISHKFSESCFCNGWLTDVICLAIFSRAASQLRLHLSSCFSLKAQLCHRSAMKPPRPPSLEVIPSLPEQW